MNSVLTINGGSSSIRFAVFEIGETMPRLLEGKIDRIGLSGTNLTVQNAAAKTRVPAAGHSSAMRFLLDWLEAQPVFASVKAIGHRVVHGMKHSEPERVTAEAARGTAADRPIGPRSPAGRDRADRGPLQPPSETAAGGVLRHCVSPHHATGRPAAARFRGAMGKKASSATASTAFPTPT